MIATILNLALECKIAFSAVAARAGCSLSSQIWIIFREFPGKSSQREAKTGLIAGNESQIISRTAGRSDRAGERNIQSLVAQRENRMLKIFISYRQKDSRGDSRQLYGRLAESFGAENFFST
jgi:hypothetical protein